MWIKTVNEFDEMRNILYNLSGTTCNIELSLGIYNKKVEINILSTVNGVTNSRMRLLSDDPRIIEIMSSHGGNLLDVLTKVFRGIETEIDSAMSDGVDLLDLEMIIDSALNSMVYGFRQKMN